jgi:4'-phosphopantetheinyl transferase EntD
MSKALLRSLLGPDIAVSEGAIIADATADLFPEEEAQVARAVAKRRIEFAAGRAHAREALAALGIAAVALPAAPDRTPLWPQGLVGSITHTESYCAAATARRSDGYAAIGIDLEPAEALPIDLWPTILTAAEDLWIRQQTNPEQGLLARAMFCAKESAYKCQFPISHEMLEFHEFEIEIDKERESFRATFQRDTQPFRKGDVLEGRMRLSDGLIATALTLRT